jgi:hypothetical protein
MEGRATVTIEASIMSMKYAMITRKKINRTYFTGLGEVFESWLISCTSPALADRVGRIYTVGIFCSNPHSILEASDHL